jgi:hypothetical protein
LATKDFAKGVSVDITLAELSVLLKQGIPHDLLYSLALDPTARTQSASSPWLSQLLALKTSAVDLPNTPTVRVAP